MATTPSPQVAEQANEVAKAQNAADATAAQIAAAEATERERRPGSYVVVQLMEKPSEDTFEGATLKVIAAGQEATSDKKAIRAACEAKEIDASHPDVLGFAAFPRLVVRKPRVEQKTVTRWDD